MLSHIIRLRQMSRLRQRLAADLHDQVGANLHAIGLLSDIAREEASMLAPTEEQTPCLALSEKSAIPPSAPRPP